jgi:hypothetical protein
MVKKRETGNECLNRLLQAYHADGGGNPLLVASYIPGKGWYAANDAVTYFLGKNFVQAVTNVHDLDCWFYLADWPETKPVKPVPHYILTSE